MFVLRAAPLGALCVLFVASAMGRPAAADTPTLPMPPPGLQAAIRELWTVNPQVQAADASRRAAQERASAAGQPVYNPSLQLDGENADVNRRTAGASLTLDAFGKREARIRQGDAEVRSQEAAYVLARRDVARDWLKAWSSVAYTREQSALGEQRLALMRRFDALAGQRLKVGDISSTERDLAGLALGEAQIEQSSLDARHADAVAALAALGGDPNGNAPARFVALPPMPAAIKAAPTSDRPELQQAQAEQERADAAVTVADRNRRPDPTISLTGGEVRSGPRTDRVVGVSISMPIPVLNSGRYEVSAARADADAAYATRRAAELRSDARLTQARATYAALRAASENFRRGRAGAFDERAALLDKLWQAGEISTSDYLVQLKQSLDTALSGIALEDQTWQAWFDYLAAAGRLTDWVTGNLKESSP